jgi:hypothetical protein
VVAALAARAAVVPPSRVQGKTPGNGVVYYGDECKATNVHLTKGMRAMFVE